MEKKKIGKRILLGGIFAIVISFLGIVLPAIMITEEQLAVMPNYIPNLAVAGCGLLFISGIVLIIVGIILMLRKNN